LIKTMNKLFLFPLAFALKLKKTAAPPNQGSFVETRGCLDCCCLLSGYFGEIRDDIRYQCMYEGNSCGKTPKIGDDGYGPCPDGDLKSFEDHSGIFYKTEFEKCFRPTEELPTPMSRCKRTEGHMKRDRSSWGDHCEEFRDSFEKAKLILPKSTQPEAPAQGSDGKKHPHRVVHHHRDDMTYTCSSEEGWCKGPAKCGLRVDDQFCGAASCKRCCNITWAKTETGEWNCEEPAVDPPALDEADIFAGSGPVSWMKVSNGFVGTVDMSL
jgi:hypothetical protein